MDEQILPGLVRRDEAEPLVVAEPLHGSCCHELLRCEVCAAIAEDASEATTAALARLHRTRNVRSDGATVAGHSSERPGTRVGAQRGWARPESRKTRLCPRWVLAFILRLASARTRMDRKGGRQSPPRISARPSE